jgi:hypothetical protein
MPDVAALYGLVGVVGGAAVGAWAAIYGPLRLHREQAEQKTMDQQAQQEQDQIARLLRVRTTGRAWLDALERTVQELEAHKLVDLDRFDDMISKLSGDATEASHSLAYNSLWVESDTTPPSGIPILPEAFDNAAVDDSTRAARSQLIGRLRDATRIVRTDILQESLPERNSVQSQRYSALNDVRAARAQLNAVLLEQIEQINKKRAQRV